MTAEEKFDRDIQLFDGNILNLITHYDLTGQTVKINDEEIPLSISELKHKVVAS
jgi:hypothetical protein